MHGSTPAIPTRPLLASAGWRFSLVFTLYAYQGIVAGFALTALPNHAAELGASTAELGAYVALIGLPWILQPLWGPVVDRFGGSRMGRRRFWVLAALGASLAAQSCLIWAGDWVGDGSAGNLPAMRASAGATAASRFALYMAALNLGDVLGSAAAGAVAGLGIAPLAVLVAGGYA